MWKFLLPILCVVFSESEAQSWDFWVPANNNVRLPSNSILAGYEDHWGIYVGRFFHKDQGWIAAKLIDKPGQNPQTPCYYVYNGIEHSCSDFEYLTGRPERYRWVGTSNGRIPFCGVLTRADFGIGRNELRGKTVVGTIDPTEGGMFAGYGGVGYRFINYEALTRAFC